MAYLKFSRDKRGYEHFYLVQPSNRGKARPRVLYWFRTPPGVKVGRTPFDPDMRRALEAQNPDVVFDWEAIIHTPIPAPVEPERWRERRRVERAFKASEIAGAASTADVSERRVQPEKMIVEPAERPLPVPVAQLIATDPAELIVPVGPAETSPAVAQGEAAQQTPQTGQTRHGRRRRRRRGRRRPQDQASAHGQASEGQRAEVSEGEPAGPEGPASLESSVQDSGEPDEKEP